MYESFLCTTKHKQPFQRHRIILEDNIKIYHKSIGREAVEWISFDRAVLNIEVT
jgi:hypothetical protein